jgi:hypothetical protein
VVITEHGKAVECPTNPDTGAGMGKEIGIHEPELPVADYEVLPQAVIDDAVEVAVELSGNNWYRIQVITDQLLATYQIVQNTDIVIIFNSGGWGWNLIGDTPGWASILDGIQTKLHELGYRTLLLNYRRAGKGMSGCVKEFVEATRWYSKRSRDLASRITFLTEHIPDLKIIICGESTGTVITDKTMGILHDNERVFSVQTGTPFWHTFTELHRTLLMNSNGRGIDTFSYGNLPVMLWSTVRGWFGLTPPDENPGNILSWLKAPGHDYSWEYPGVCSEVVGFLEKQFQVKK